MARNPPQPAQHARHLRPEHAPVGVRLVDDHVLQVAEELGPQRVVGQDAGVEHVGVGQQDARLLADAVAGALRRVAVVGGGQRVDDARPRRLDERLPLAQLVLRQRLGGVEVQRPGERIARQRFEHRDVEGERLARGGRGGDDDVVARQRQVDRLRLVRVEPLGACRPQRRQRRPAQAVAHLPEAGSPGRQGLRVDDLPGVALAVAQRVEELDRVKSHSSAR